MAKWPKSQIVEANYSMWSQKDAFAGPGCFVAFFSEVPTVCSFVVCWACCRGGIGAGIVMTHSGASFSLFLSFSMHSLLLRSFVSYWFVSWQKVGPGLRGISPGLWRQGFWLERLFILAGVNTYLQRFFTLGALLIYAVVVQNSAITLTQFFSLIHLSQVFCCCLFLATHNLIKSQRLLEKIRPSCSALRAQLPSNFIKMDLRSSMWATQSGTFFS